MMRDYAVIAKEVDLYLPSLFYRFSVIVWF